MRFINLLVRRNKTKPKNQELYFATILYPTYTVGIITKCEGVHFYTRVDVSKLVVHEKFTWENFLLQFRVRVNPSKYLEIFVNEILIYFCFIMQVYQDCNKMLLQFFYRIGIIQLILQELLQNVRVFTSFYTRVDISKPLKYLKIFV